MPAATIAICRRQALRLLGGATASLGLFGCGGGGDAGSPSAGAGEQAGSLALAAATTFDAEAEFSASANPNGPWSYGWSRRLGSGFTLDARSDGSTTWNGPIHSSGRDVPSIEHRDGALFLRPGPDNEFAVLRFTAAVAGTYLVETLFRGSGANNTLAYLLQDGEVVVQFVAHDSEHRRTNPQRLMAGSTMEVAVGFGLDCTSIGDDTLVSMRLSLIE
jgi:hypothetical protein